MISIVGEMIERCRSARGMEKLLLWRATIFVYDFIFKFQIEMAKVPPNDHIGALKEGFNLFEKQAVVDRV